MFIDKSNKLRNVTNWRGKEWQTTATEFSLICDRKIVNKLLTSIGMAGLFLGALFGGAFAERFGRRMGIIVGMSANIVSYVLIAFMPNEYGYMVMRLFIMTTGHAAWIAYCAYVMEIVGPTYRAVAGTSTMVVSCSGELFIVSDENIC